MRETYSAVDHAETLVNALEDQYLAALNCEFFRVSALHKFDRAEELHQDELNEIYRLQHPTEPDSNDIQHFYDDSDEEEQGR